MFTNYAIANKTSIMYKYKFSVGTDDICSNISLSSSVAGYYFNTNYPIEEIGVYYYTTNQSNKTILPMSKLTFSNLYLSVSANSITDGSITYKSRIVLTAPIFVLIKGLTENTTYHVGAYYKIGTAYTYFNEETVTTKPASYTALIFTRVDIGGSVPSSMQTNAETYKTNLENILPVVIDIFNDATNVDYSYIATVTYDPYNWAADGGMNFNCNFMDSGDTLRSVIIHELEHNHFIPHMMQSDYLSKYEYAIKFMEFATDCEGASWGQIYTHYYPIISSARYDYVDDYLVAMATDVDYLFNVNVTT